MDSVKICSKCVLTDKTPGIHFDEKGICNYCHSYQPMQVQGEQELIKIFNQYKSKNKKYDCVIGLSGGRDSTYTIWKLVNDYKLNVLVTTYENPFTSEQAKQNIQNAIKILKVDHVPWEFPNDIHRKSTKKVLKVWSHHPSSSMIPLVCGYCKTWWPGYFKVVHDHDVNLMVIGSNPLETASFKKAGFGGARTYHKFSNVPKIIMKSMKEIIANPRYLTTNPNMVLRMYLGASHSTPYLKWRYKGIRVLRLFDYLKWNEAEVESTITKNLDWKKSPEVASSWRFDCRLDYIRRVMYASTTGVTELRDLFGKMIREGMITRDEALKRLEKEDVVPKKVAEDVLNSLDMSLSDLNLHLDENLLV